MFEVIETQPKEVAALISRAVTLDREIRQRKKSLEAIKAKLQTAALAEMENKNLRYVRYDSLYGSAETTYKTKLEIDNYARLAAALDASVLVEDKIVRRLSVKYDVDARFKEALIALVRGDYAEHDIDGILLGMGLEDAKMRKGRAPHGARGLKPCQCVPQALCAQSRPARGAWIETYVRKIPPKLLPVAPRTGRVD